MSEISPSFAMKFTLARILAHISCLCLAVCPLLYGQCPVNSIVIKGHVERPPRNASVRVLLLYPPDPHKKYPPGTDMQGYDRSGESAEAILDGEAFTIPVEFLTNDSRTEISYLSKCNRKPHTVVVTLQLSDESGNNPQELDRVSLDFPREFKSDDAQHYSLRSDLILNHDEH